MYKIKYHKNIIIFLIILIIIFLIYNYTKNPTSFVVSDSKGINNNIDLFNKKAINNIPIELKNRDIEDLRLLINLKCANFQNNKNCNENILLIENNEIVIKKNTLLLVPISINYNSAKKNYKYFFNVSFIKEDNSIYDYMIFDIRFS
jgi:hypothetical protein